MPLSLLVALAALIIASLFAGYWLNDLFKGCSYAVLSFCALASLYEGSIAAFTLEGLASVILMYASFFVCCFVFRILRNELNRREQSRLQSEAAIYQEHHPGDAQLPCEYDQDYDRFSR